MKHRKIEDGRALVGAYLASGKSALAFSREAGCSFPALQYWKKRVKDLEAVQSESKRFVEVSKGAAFARVMTVEIGGVRLSFDALPTAAWLSSLMAELRRQ